MSSARTATLPSILMVHINALKLAMFLKACYLLEDPVKKNAARDILKSTMQKLEMNVR